MSRNYLIIVLLVFTFFTNAKSQQFQVLFDSNDEGVSCYRIPAIVKAINGDLIVAVDERIPSCADLRGSNDINIVIRRSTDDGKTWLPKEKVIDFELRKSASDPAFIIDHETGEIFLFYNYMNIDKEPDIYYFQFVSSKDNGSSWSEPTDITSQVSQLDAKEDFKFITSGCGIQAKNGYLLHTIVNLDKGVFIFGSIDHGRNWRTFGNPIKPGDESKIIVLENGTWMVNSRVQNAGLRWIHTSTDEGETWSSKPDSTLVDPACNASLINLGSDVLYFSNIDHENKRENLVLRKSIDGGLQWEREISIYAGSAAYSTMTKIADGELGIVFEKDDYGQVVFYHFVEGKK